MSWLLTVFMFLPDGSAVRTEVGIMTDEPICNIAGHGFAVLLEAETPGMEVVWTCDNLGAAA